MLDITAARREYDAIGRVRCPYLEGDVLFTAEGFDHLLYKNSSRARPEKERVSRLKALRVVVAILKRSGTLQEYRETKQFIHRKLAGRWSQILTLIRFFCFSAIIESRRYKVVVRKVEGESWKFHSIFPLSQLIDVQEAHE